jgi:hypothetical protein
VACQFGGRFCSLRLHIATQAGSFITPGSVHKQHYAARSAHTCVCEMCVEHVLRSFPEWLAYLAVRQRAGCVLVVSSAERESES